MELIHKRYERSCFNVGLHYHNGDFELKLHIGQNEVIIKAIASFRDAVKVTFREYRRFRGTL